MSRAARKAYDATCRLRDEKIISVWQRINLVKNIMLRIEKQSNHARKYLACHGRERERDLVEEGRRHLVYKKPTNCFELCYTEIAKSFDASI